MMQAGPTNPRIRDEQTYTDATYRAVELFNGGDYHEAIPQLQEMSRVNPNNIKVHEVLADAYLRTAQVDQAAREMYVIRTLAAAYYPGLSLDERKTFDQLADAAGPAGELRTRYESLLDSASVSELLENSDVPTKLSVKLMADGEYTQAEDILVRYGERLTALREKSRSGVI